jgi:HPt (histidine-containing phosphotransfer) domain-containing protein
VQGCICKLRNAASFVKNSGWGVYMSEDLEKKLLGGVAYKMFCAEVEKHLSAADVFFGQESWTADALQEMSGRFHTIRGAAGFFKLVEVAAISGELEKALIADGPSKVFAQSDYLREQYSKLKEAAARLPQPAA